MWVFVGLGADVGGCSLAADGFGLQSVCLGPFIFFCCLEVAKSTSPVGTKLI